MHPAVCNHHRQNHAEPGNSYFKPHGIFSSGNSFSYVYLHTWFIRNSHPHLSLQPFGRLSIEIRATREGTVNPPLLMGQGKAKSRSSGVPPSPRSSAHSRTVKLFL